jgi:hypothetical protein
MDTSNRRNHIPFLYISSQLSYCGMSPYDWQKAEGSLQLPLSAVLMKQFIRMHVRQQQFVHRFPCALLLVS